MNIDEFMYKYLVYDNNRDMYLLKNISIINASKYRMETKMLNMLFGAKNQVDDEYSSYYECNGLRMCGMITEKYIIRGMFTNKLSEKDIYYYPEVEDIIIELYKSIKNGDLFSKNQTELYKSLGMEVVND